MKIELTTGEYKYIMDLLVKEEEKCIEIVNDIYLYSKQFKETTQKTLINVQGLRFKLKCTKMEKK